MESNYHIPVLLKEAIESLNIKPDGIYVDCTFGGGGHSKEILKYLNEKGRLIAFDQDEDAGKNLPEDSRIFFLPHNFRHLQRFLHLHKIKEIDGLLADLGVSSYQFDKAERGFSIRFNANLDMRMDQRQGVTAEEVLKSFTESRLHKMLEHYGEVTNAKTLARTIVQQRELMPIKTIEQFKQAVQGVVKGNPQKYFAQVFQALRIEVNDELGALKELLQQIPTLMKPGAYVAIITFHSLEDRIVKNFFRNGTFLETAGDEIFGTKQESPFRVITKKPIIPSEAEIRNNPRARSAKLRVAKKIISNQKND